jgi:hypothetical protein
LWTLAYGQHEGRTPTHGYEATREAARCGVREELGGGLGQVEPEQEKWWMRSIAPWSRQDLFFVENSLQRGSSFAETASFLGRDEDEVRQKAET